MLEGVCRPELVRFAQLMEEQLEANDQWGSNTPWVLKGVLGQILLALEFEAETEDDTVAAAVTIANFSMMLADNILGGHPAYRKLVEGMAPVPIAFLGLAWGRRNRIDLSLWWLRGKWPSFCRFTIWRIGLAWKLRRHVPCPVPRR